MDLAPTLREKILNFLNVPSNGMLFSGPAGTGKTHAMAAITRHRILSGKAADFRRWETLYASLRESYRTNSSEDSVLRAYFRHPFLSLDDLGAGGFTDHVKRCTFEVLEERITHRLPTVITTNLTLKDVGRLMDDRIASRLSNFSVFRFVGRDRRMPGAGEGGEQGDGPPFVVEK